MCRPTRITPPTFAAAQGAETPDRPLWFPTPLARLFSWIDTESSGSLSAEALTTAINALLPPGAPSETKSAAVGELRGMEPGELIKQIMAAGGASGDEDAGGIDFDTYIRIMTLQAVTEIKGGDRKGPKSLRAAFDAIDTDESGTITIEEMLTAVNNVCEILPAPGLQNACEDSSLVSSAFDAFDADRSGGIDFEEFVSMVSGRGDGVVYEGDLAGSS
jgi:Ca2+-binding EF-hand superfamily protein